MSERGADRAAVFLDRDGVLTEPVVVDGRERPPWTLGELRIMGDAAEALRRLKQREFLLVAVTNQPDIGRGQARADDVAAINAIVADTLGLDAVYVCPHGGVPPCDCRKPLPGMLHAAASDLAVDLERSWLVGDRWVDIAAGVAAGVRSILLARPGSWDATSAGSPSADLRPDATVDTLAEAVAVILAGRPPVS